MNICYIYLVIGISLLIDEQFDSIINKIQVDRTNTVASNIFDFLICLPLPDFLYLFFNRNDENPINSSFNREFVSILISVIIDFI